MQLQKILILAAFCAISASAQSISIGAIGGAPFTDVVNSTNQNGILSVSKSTNFTVGPSFQINLPLSFRIEADALYRPYSFSATPAASLYAPVTVSANEWTFPILAQYRFSLPLVKPFAEVGVSFDHLSNLSAAAQGFAPFHQTNEGFVLGGGIDVKIPFIRLSGELRYTHQGSAYFAGFSNVNQAEVLIGVHF